MIKNNTPNDDGISSTYMDFQSFQYKEDNPDNETHQDEATHPLSHVSLSSRGRTSSRGTIRKFSLCMRESADSQA